MSINRNNYEEYFILYMDNELGAEERGQVEEFLAKNPDLKEEFDVLIQYKLVPDTTIQFENKTQLIKTAEYSPVNMANYSEWLVLYMDNELGAEEKTAVEQFMAAYPSAKLDMDLLLKTRLQPEEIPFPGKQSLYHREERAIPLRWWRIAAAAVLLIGISTTAVVLLNKKPLVENGGLAGLPVSVQPAEEKALVITTENESPVIQPVDQPAITPVTKQAVEPGNMAVKKFKPGVKMPVSTKKDEPVLVENQPKPNNNLPQPLNNPNLKLNTVNKTDVANTKPILENQPSVKTNDAVTTNSPHPSDLKHASINTNDDVVFNQPDAKRNKLRGLLRKVTRTFEKTTNTTVTDNEDRVLIAGLSLKLK